MPGKELMRMTVLSGAVLMVALGCGRSEQVGWSDREGRQTEGGAAMEEGEQLQQGSPQALMQEYQQRAQSLEGLRVQAMQDDRLQRMWDSLTAAVDDRMVELNPGLETLIGRAEEIENRVAEVQRAGDTLTAQEQQMLAMQYQNIQNTLGQARSQVYQEEEFSDRLESFQHALYEQMRQLAPDRAGAVDTLQQLGDRIIAMLDSIRSAEEASSMGDTAAGAQGSGGR